MTYEEIFQIGIKLSSLKDFETDRAIEIIGRFVDAAVSLKRVDGLKHAVHLLSLIEKRNLDSKQKVLLHYFTANAWSKIKILGKGNNDFSWVWQQKELEHEICHFRYALIEKGLPQLPPERFCQIAVNLGNCLNQIGRIVEAIEYENKALEKLPKFAMALANRGTKYHEYAKLLFAIKPTEAIYFLLAAKRDLEKALSLQDGNFYSDAREPIRKLLTEITEWLQGNKIHDVNYERLSHKKIKPNDGKELKYVKWCLENKLFLNPLNDIGSFQAAAGDTFNLSRIKVKIGDPPYYFGLFNQLVLEYVSARNLYYEGHANYRPCSHCSGITLIDTLDYPIYSLDAEKIKIAYRVAYSCFDKIAFFINKYFELGVPDGQVSFRKIWFKDNRSDELKDVFKDRKNLPLRGLFWLSKDLFEDEPRFRNSIEPEAQELAKIRNHLEHKYLKLHEMLATERGAFTDTVSYSIKLKDFEGKALTVLKLVRASIMYLAFSISIEEGKERDARLPTMHLPTYER